MLINELRFGNLVTFNGEDIDYPLKITGILNEGWLYIEWQVDGIEPGGSECELEGLRGIELTNVFLVKNGFSEDNNGYFWINLKTHYLTLIPTSDGYYPVYTEIPEMSSEPEQSVGLNKINFIHELQNLLYVLTGKEMEIVW
jgi:hypothetical protein